LSKQYRTARREMRSFAGLMLGFLAAVLLLLVPVFNLWGTAWWIDAVALLVLILALGAFALGGSLYLRQATLKLEIDPAGLRLRNWRASRFLPWSDVAAWCAVEIEDGARLICLKAHSAKEPVAIDPDLLDGHQFARIYREVEEHCGPPSPGAAILGDNHGDPFTDEHP
jgi:hypothetical protein